MYNRIKRNSNALHVFLDNHIHMKPLKKSKAKPRKHILNIVTILLFLTGCKTYDQLPFWTPDSWNATYSRDQAGFQTYYLGVSGPLKHNTP